MPYRDHRAHCWAISAVLAAIASAASVGTGCEGPCTPFDAETHFLTPAVDAGIPETGTRPPQQDCRRLCGDDEDPSDSERPHPTSCQILEDDAGQPLVACDESAYEVCSPLR
jgi:hypothetical protein